MIWRVRNEYILDFRFAWVATTWNPDRDPMPPPSRSNFRLWTSSYVIRPHPSYVFCFAEIKR